MTIPIQLSKYPASTGPKNARQLRHQIELWKEQIAQIDAELQKTELVFDKAIDRADTAKTARDRIKALASKPRRI